MNKHSTIVFLLALIISVAVARTIKPANVFNKPNEEHQDEEYTVTIRRSDPNEATSGNLYHNFVNYMKQYDTAMGRSVQRSVQDDEPVDWGKIVNIGKQIWDIVVKNQPIMDAKNISSGTFVPAGITDWHQLTNWKRPVNVPYTVEWKNMLGFTVIKFQFQVVFIPGGKYQNKGLFLTGVTVIPTNIEVTWSYSFNCNVDIPQVLNVGDTPEDPIAAAQINLKLDFDGKQKQTRSWFVKGNGEIDEI